MKKVQTDNSFLKQKIDLRMRFISGIESPVILNCYTGKNIIWSKINESKKVTTYNIDLEKRKNAVQGDNRKLLPSLNLEQFDAIDLDAYGSPIEQLKIIFDKKYKGIIFVTFIQSLLGSINYRMLNELGFHNKMLLKCKTVFFQNGFENFKNWLSLYGVEKIFHISIHRKHYACFQCK